MMNMIDPEMLKMLYAERYNRLTAERWSGEQLARTRRIRRAQGVDVRAGER